MDTEKELIRLNDELVQNISELVKYLGQWFDRNGKMINEIDHGRFPIISSAIMAYAMEIHADNACRNYLLACKRGNEIIEMLKIKEEAEDHDEPDERIQSTDEGEQ